MTRLLPLLFSSLVYLTLSAAQPNVVLYIADDHGRNDSSVYNSTGDALTPQMQRLASAGLTFDQAFVASPACGPSRSALLSGLMPIRNGAEHNHEKPNLETQTMIRQLKKTGYEVAAFGKVHHNKWIEAVGADHVYPTRNNLEKSVQDYLNTRASKKPLLLIVGDVRTHAPWHEHDTYHDMDLTVPSHWVDTPDTRQTWENYLGEVTEVDTTVGNIDDIARAHFGTDDFLSIYTSDHGHAFPFGKWNLYDWGTQVAFIARWPGVIKPNTRTEAMISWIDIFPTLIDLAGADVPTNIDGRSFASVLRGDSDNHRDLVFTTHSGDGDKNIYPIRAVRDQRFKYIRNTHPDTYHTTHTDIQRRPGHGALFNEWVAAAETDPYARAVVRKYHYRPTVEFYDIIKDPGETTNLVNDPAYAPEVDRLGTALDDWMTRHGDNVRMEREPYALTEAYPGAGPTVEP